MATYCSQCGKPLAQGANFCISCGASLVGKAAVKQEWTEKRAKVLGKHRAKRKSPLRTQVIVAIIAIAGIWSYFNLPKGGNPVIRTQPVVATPPKYATTVEHMFDIPSRVEKGKIIVPLDIVKGKKIVAFNYSAPKNITPLLAYMSSEGKIVTAISMCEPCNSKRFHIKGETLVCNACGSTWELDNLRAISGACGKYPPDAIPSVVVGNEVQIDEAIVARWQRRI